MRWPPVGGQTSLYDANGNRLTGTQPGGIISYTWDGRNRLQSITQPGGATTQFTYDFGDNLIQQIVTKTEPPPRPATGTKYAMWSHRLVWKRAARVANRDRAGHSFRHFYFGRTAGISPA